METVKPVPSPPVAEETTPARRPGAKLSTLLTLLAFTTTAALSFGLIAKRIALWEADLTVPFEYGHDSFLIHCWVKTQLDTGWWMTTDRCGAPFQHEMYDFPTNPNLHFAALKGLAVFTQEPGVLMNVYFLLGFPLAGLTAHAALRGMRASHWVSILGGVLYAHQPYHYWRGIDHLFLGTYFMLPLVTLVMVWLFRGEPLLFARNAAGKVKLAFNWRTGVALLVLAAEGFDFPYYPIFSGIFLVVAAFAGASLNRDRVVFLRAAGLLAVLLAAFVVNMWPNLTYYAKHGTNKVEDHFTHRPWTDGESFAVMPIQMLMPTPNHPIKQLDKLQQKYNEGTKLPSEGGSCPIGLGGSLGFLFLLFALATQFRSDTYRGRVLFLLGLLLAAGIFFCTVGGFGTLFNLLSLTIARTYVRVSIFLAFFCVAGFGLTLDVAYQWALGRWKWAWVAVAVVTAGLVAAGYKDQTGTSYMETYQSVRPEFYQDREFVADVEKQIPADGAVFQLPYIAFGSYTNQYAKMEPYAHFAPYVHSRTSRWSFGAMYGRPEEAELARIGQLAPEALLPMLVAYQFKGVYVDRFGYPDGGIALEGQLRQLTGVEPLVVSKNNRMAFYSLAAYEAKLKGNTPDDQWEARKREIRDYLHTSPLVRFGQGIDPEERTDVAGWEQFRWVRLPNGTVHLTNQTAQPQRVRVRFSARTHHPGKWELHVKGIGLDETIGVNADLTAFERVIDLPPGAHSLRFVCNAPPYDAKNSRVFNLYRPTFELVDPPPRSLAGGDK